MTLLLVNKNSIRKRTLYQIIISIPFSRKNQNYIFFVNIQNLVNEACMMTSSNGNIFRVTGHLYGKFTGPGEFPAQRPVTQSFDVCFDLRLNKRLSKQSLGWWFETLLCQLWRHSNVSRGTNPFDIHTEPECWETFSRQTYCRVSKKLAIWPQVSRAGARLTRVHGQPSFVQRVIYE